MTDPMFGLEWSYYSLHGRFNNISSLLANSPNSLFQLSLWTEAMIVARINHLDVPDSAVFYLSGRKYEPIIKNFLQSEKVIIITKLSIAAHIFQIRSSERLLRQIQQTVMTACSLYSFVHPDVQLIKTKAIFNYFKAQGCFLKEICIQMVANQFSSRIRQNRQLKDMGDVFLGTLIVQQLASNTFTMETLKKFIIFYKKQSVLFRIMEHIARHFKPELADVAIQLAQNFGQLSQILKVLENNPKPFYRFHQVITRNHKECEFKHFSNFMINHSSARTVTLFRILFELDLLTNNESDVSPLITRQSNNIFKYFSRNPLNVARDCIQSYLDLSAFVVPYQKKEQSLSNPLTAVGIMRRYWEHDFHKEVVSCSVWALLDLQMARLNLMKTSNYKSEQIKTYRRHLFEVLLFVSLSYSASTFIKYYPVEYSRLQQIFSLEHLPALLLSCPENLECITWLQHYFRSELPRILKVEDGYQLIWRAINLRLINAKSYGASIIQIMESDLLNLNTVLNVLNAKEWACKILMQLSITEIWYEASLKLMQKISVFDTSMRALLI